MTEQQTGGQPTTSEKTFTQKDIEAERAHAQHFQQQLEGITSKLNGKDLDTILQRAAKADELENAAAGSDPKKLQERLTAVKSETEKELTTRFSGKIEELEKTKETYEAELNEFRIVTPGLEEATKLEFLDEARDEVKRELIKNCRWSAEQKRVVIVDENGKPRYKASNPNELMTQDDLLKEIGEKKKHWLKPSVTRGTHTGETKLKGANGVLSIPPDFKTWDQARQTKFFTDNPELRKQVLENAPR